MTRINGDINPTELTMRDVADVAGVALSSVSRVLNDHPDVSDAMRERVQRAVEKLGYEPNFIASSLRRGSTMTVGFVVADIANPLFAEFSKGAGRKLDQAGFSIVLANSESDPMRDEQLARLFRWRRVDGLIMSLADETREETIRELQRLESPIVLFDRAVENLPQASMVTADHAGGLRRATDHLLDLGHERIALVTGRKHLRPTQERVRGFTEAYEARHQKAPMDLVRLGSFDADFAESATTQLLGIADPPTAIISGSNQLLVGVLRTLRREKRRVGKDIALVACDDVPLAELHDPPITVVYRDTVKMGELAAELLLERIQGEETEPRVATVPTELLVRDSTFPLKR
jgi:LacI family transcriptional regulator